MVISECTREVEGAKDGEGWRGKDEGGEKEDQIGKDKSGKEWNEDDEGWEEEEGGRKREGVP